MEKRERFISFLFIAFLWVSARCNCRHPPLPLRESRCACSDFLALVHLVTNMCIRGVNAGIKPHTRHHCHVHTRHCAASAHKSYRTYKDADETYMDAISLSVCACAYSQVAAQVPVLGAGCGGSAVVADVDAIADITHFLLECEPAQLIDMATRAATSSGVGSRENRRYSCGFQASRQNYSLT